MEEKKLCRKQAYREEKKNKIYTAIWEKLDKEDNDKVNIKRKIIAEIVEETS